MPREKLDITGDLEKFIGTGKLPAALGDLTGMMLISSVCLHNLCYFVNDLHTKYCFINSFLYFLFLVKALIFFQ